MPKARASRPDSRHEPEKILVREVIYAKFALFLARERSESTAARMQTCSVSVNDIAVAYGIAEVPFGGLKSSGVGKVNGELAICGDCHLRPIITDTTNEAEGGYPYAIEKAEGLQKLVKTVFGNRWLRKLFV